MKHFVCVHDIIPVPTQIPVLYAEMMMMMSDFNESVLKGK